MGRRRSAEEYNRTASLEIADNNDGRAVDDGTDKRPRPFLLNVIAEDDDGLVDDGRPPARRRRRASSRARSPIDH
jgi:hypothetical protein